MKLLFLINNEKVIGGGDYSIFKFAEYLAKLGHSVTIIANYKNEFFNAYKLPKGLNVKYRGVFPLKIKGYGFIQEKWEKIYDNMHLSGQVRKKPDFLVGYQKSSSISAAKLGEKFNIPLVNFIFEAPSEAKKQHKEWAKVFDNPKTKRVWEKFKKSILKSDIVLANSKLSRKETEDWIKKSIAGFIYPGIDLDLIDKIPEQKKENQIIYIGRLYEVKNIDRVIKALSMIKNPPTFVICGDGEEKRNLIDLAKKLKVKCEFKGRVTDYEKWVLIKKSKFMVFPSSFEGFGMPPMEALYCKIPCIVFDIPIFKEVYDNKVEYIKDGNINELSKIIKKLLDNPEYCKKKGIEGKKYIKNKFSWLKSARKIEKILQGYKAK